MLILPTGAENPSYVGLKAVTRGVFWVFEHPAKFQGKIRHTKIDLLLVTKFTRGVEPTVSRFVVKTVFMPSTSLEMHQNRFRLGLRPGPHWGSLQRSLRPLAGGEGARRVLPKNPTPSSALRASAIQAMLCRPPTPPKINPSYGLISRPIQVSALSISSESTIVEITDSV